MSRFQAIYEADFNKYDGSLRIEKKYYAGRDNLFETNKKTIIHCSFFILRNISKKYNQIDTVGNKNLQLQLQVFHG